MILRQAFSLSLIIILYELYMRVFGKMLTVCYKTVTCEMIFVSKSTVKLLPLRSEMFI
jgi:hypothetical protein